MDTPATPPRRPLWRDIPFVIGLALAGAAIAYAAYHIWHMVTGEPSYTPGYPMSHEAAAFRAGRIGTTATILSATLPLALWFTTQRLWRPTSRLGRAVRLSFWPNILFLASLGGPLARVLLDGDWNSTQRLKTAAIGQLGALILLGVPMFLIGLICFRRPPKDSTELRATSSQTGTAALTPSNASQHAPPTSRWKRAMQSSREFRMWAFASIAWPILLLLFLVAWDPFHPHGPDDVDVVRVLFAMVAPALAGLVRLAFIRIVK